MNQYHYEWPEQVSSSDLYSSQNIPLYAIIPNLDRRPGRWQTCLQKLLEMGFPKERIQRFSAFDYKNYKTINDAKRHALSHFSNDFPPLLAKTTLLAVNDISGFCWLWSWYTIIDKISRTKNRYHLLLVDDCCVTMSYTKLCLSIHMLNQASPKFANIIQVSRARGILLHRPLVPQLDIWQYGLCGRTDAATILNATGATDIMKEANSKPDVHVPADIMEQLAYHENQTGYYALSAKYEPLSGDGYGACVCFDARPEYQDRMASLGCNT